MYLNRRTSLPAILPSTEDRSLISLKESLMRKVLASGWISPSQLPPVRAGLTQQQLGDQVKWDSSSFSLSMGYFPPSTPMVSPTGRHQSSSLALSHATYSPTPGPLGRAPKDQMEKIMGETISPGKASLANLLGIKGWDSPYRSRYAAARTSLERKLKVKYTAIDKDRHKEWLERLPQ